MNECKYSVGGLVEIIKAASVLFFAYLGFATISQAGGEAKNPTKYLPLAFVISSLIIIAYYISFSAAVYHTAPWEYISVCAEKGKITAPGIIGILLPTSLAVFVLLMAALALANDIPPMLMAVSRLFFSWAKDGIFPASLAQVNKRFKTPHWALTISAIIASLVILECHRFGFFLGVDLITIALVFTYILVSFTVITLPYRDRNLELYKEIAFVKNRICQVLVSLFAVITLGTLFITLVIKDVTAPRVWYSKSVYIWLLVMLVGAIIFFIKWDSATVKGINLSKTLRTLPEE
jgi:amino acid transporter